MWMDIGMDMEMSASGIASAKLPDASAMRCFFKGVLTIFNNPKLNRYRGVF